MDQGPNHYAPPRSPAGPALTTTPIDATHVHYGRFAVRAGARLIDFVFELVLSSAGAFGAGIVVALVSGPHALSNADKGASSLLGSIGIGMVSRASRSARSRSSCNRCDARDRNRDRGRGHVASTSRRAQADPAALRERARRPSMS